MHKPSCALITPPTAEVVTLAACKAALGIIGTDRDDILRAALAASVAQLDPAAGGRLGRALRPQTWELRLCSFQNHGCHHPLFSPAAIALPYPKLIEILSIKYDDVAGVERTLVQNTDFNVLGTGTLGRQAVAPVPDRYWPVARAEAESVRIRYRAGYAPAVGADPGPAVADELPPAITQAIALGVRLLVSNAERNLYIVSDSTVGVGDTRYAVSPAANQLLRDAMGDLLSSHRVFA